MTAADTATESPSSASLDASRGRSLDARIVERQSIEATVIRACRACGSAGEEGVRICRHCGADRPPDEPQGVLWQKTFTA